jgi:hypothetical protein
MNDKVYSLSKTSFLKFEQCQKAFFLYKNHPYLRDKITIDKQLTFKRGHDVGFFAQQLFPGGVDVSQQIKNAAEGVAITKTLIENKTPVIYEATFVFNHVLIMIDILSLQDDGYVAYEVKSSLKVSENYIKDACLQYYVLKNSVNNLQDFFLVTLNGDYVLQETLIPKNLFKKRSIKSKAEANIGYFETKVSDAMAILEQNVIPNIAIGKHCFRPYACDYIGTCWKDTLTDDSIFNLPIIDRSKLFEWHEAGINNISQLDENLLEKEKFINVKNAFVSGEPIINYDKIKQFLTQVKLPVAAMDMEIWSAAIPEIIGTRPFEQVPFLVCFSDETKSTHFFTDNKPDARKDFALNLIELSLPYSTILVYDKTMEVAAIDNLAMIYPEYQAHLNDLKLKFLDVFEAFLGLWYYHPDFQNNFSLKVISQFLFNDILYSSIASGMEAINVYSQYRLEENVIMKEKLKADLIAYCETDTKATFKILDFLRNICA